jgi:hypothetical protein
MRIQQTIKSQEGIIMTYKITNLVQFYLVTMRKTIGSDAVLTDNLQQSAYRPALGMKLTK